MFVGDGGDGVDGVDGSLLLMKGAIMRRSSIFHFCRGST